MSKTQKIVSFDALSKLSLPSVVHCHGVFDILHAGHLAYFKAAKAHGHTLVVTLTSDRYVNKGPGRPYFPAEIRAEMLAALELVDYVAISDYPTAVPAIEALKPMFYVKGPDYKDRTKDVTGEIYNEEKAVRAGGGDIVFTDEEMFSSSYLINKAFPIWTDAQIKVIERVKALGGESRVYQVIEQMQKERILVVGEPIWDVYRFCVPENISSKSPSISARFAYMERYEGGTWAIRRHLMDFCKDVRSIYPSDLVIPEKVRYISLDKSQRIFEVTYLPRNDWRSKDEKFKERLLLKAKEADVVIAADFGHGVFEGENLDLLPRLPNYIGLNVQTNSSNFGFNSFDKHQRFNYLAMDTREARLALRDRTSDPLTIFRHLRKSFSREKILALTVGSNGAYMFSQDEHFCPAFADVVVDATGAGDAFFALSTVLLKMDVEPEIVLFLSNVFAGLKTKIIGNKSGVSKASLLKAATSILK